MAICNNISIMVIAHVKNAELAIQKAKDGRSHSIIDNIDLEVEAAVERVERHAKEKMIIQKLISEDCLIDMYSPRGNTWMN